jgi:hypothetical protein
MTLDPLKDFIYTHYNVHWQHPESEGNWDTFLIAETHDTPEIQKINGLFLSLFSTEESPIFIEGESVEVRESREIYASKYFPSEKPPEGPIFGWDRESPSILFIHHTLDFLKAALLSNDIETLTANIEEWSHNLSDKYADLSKYGELNASFHFTKKFLGKVIRSRVSTEEAKAMIEEKSMQFMAQLSEIINKTFPFRTDSMIQTLQLANQHYNKEPKFLIAGIAHLKEAEKSTPYFDELNSLIPLYDYLGAEGKNTIVLIPKSIDEPVIFKNYFLKKEMAAKLKTAWKNYTSKKKESIEREMWEKST